MLAAWKVGKFQGIHEVLPAMLLVMWKMHDGNENSLKEITESQTWKYISFVGELKVSRFEESMARYVYTL